MEDGSMKIVEIRADARRSRGQSYEVRTGPIGRALVWLALVVGLILGLAVLIPLAMLGALVGIAVLALWLIYVGVGALGSAASRRLAGSGRRNVRVVRGQ